MKILRLLITKKCHRNCNRCCNKSWNLDILPGVIDYTPYDIICITGGEPMLYPHRVINIVEKIRKVSGANIYIYTAKVDDLTEICHVLFHVDGLTVTLHEPEDLESFIELNNHLLENKILNKSMRLNVFKPVNVEGIDLSLWECKLNVEWVINCPLPKNEVFMQQRL